MAKKNNNTVDTCSFCGKEDDGSDVFLANEAKTATICKGCATLLANYSPATEADSVHSPKQGETNAINQIKGKMEYPILQQISIGLIIDGSDDLIECMKTPSILILSSEGYESNLLIISDEDQRVFDDVYEAYDFSAKYIAESGDVDLSHKVILGLITSTSDEDEDGMYDIIENEGGELLLSQTISIENLMGEAEDGLNNTDLSNKPFCLIQYTEDANIKIEDGNLLVDDDVIEMSEITSLSGYMEWLENKVGIYIN